MKNANTQGFSASPEVTLMADFQQAIVEYGERLGYGEGEIMAEHHSNQVAAAVQWLCLLYGPPA